MKLVKPLLALVVATSAWSAQAATELVTNGSFESLTVGNPVGTYLKVASGANTITGWKVGSNSVDVINGAYGAISGNSIDMLGTPGPGSLSQSLNTVANQTYQLSFDLSYNGGAYKDIFFAFGGDTGTATATSNTGPFYHYVGNYTADATSTLLSFYSFSANYSGVVLDNVSVTAVPEPQTYAMLLAGLGLMGAIARRRSKQNQA